MNVNETAQKVSSCRPSAGLRSAFATMMRIIDGKVYDTTTAEHLCQIANGFSPDLTCHWTSLYRSPGGQFFLAGHGKGNSLWGHQVAPHLRGSGAGMLLQTEEEARAIVLRCCSAETFIRVFGELAAG